LVNSLFEFNVATNLDDLLVRYVPGEGFDEVNDYYQKLADCWNYIINGTKVLLEQETLPELPAGTPAVVRTLLSNMKRVVRAAANVKAGSPRASLVEPQLGYYLRELEMAVQKGLGCGHGLVAIFEVVK